MATVLTAVLALVLGRQSVLSLDTLGNSSTVVASDAVVLLAHGLAAVLATWLTGLLALTTAALLPGGTGAAGRRLSGLLAPTLSRALGGLLVSVAAVAVAVPAQAGPVRATGPAATTERVPGAGTTDGAWQPPDPSFLPGTDASPPALWNSAPEGAAAGVATPACAPEPGWRPPRPAVPGATASGQIALLSRCPATRERAEVVVRSGDSLWRIASRHLGPDASVSQIAAEWPRWYAANRSVIGDDPDLLLPGQVLTPPAEPPPPVEPSTTDQGS